MIRTVNITFQIDEYDLGDVQQYLGNLANDLDTQVKVWVLPAWTDESGNIPPVIAWTFGG